LLHYDIVSYLNPKECAMPKVGDEYREEVKTRVILAALDVFSRNGYHNTKMDDIAKKASVSKGTLYNHFSGKEELFRGIAEFLFKKEMTLCEAMFTENDPVQSFRIMFDGISKLYEGKTGFLSEIFSLVERDEKMRAILSEAFAKEVEGFAQIISKMQSKGTIRQDIDPSSFAILLMALYMGIFMCRRMFDESLLREQDLMDIGLRSILFER